MSDRCRGGARVTAPSSRRHRHSPPSLPDRYNATLAAPELDAQAARGGEEPRMADHAVIWTDRACLDVPRTPHDLLRFRQPERCAVVVERLAQERGLIDRRQICQEDAARSESGRGGGDDFVGLWHIEEDAVKVALVDALGDVPYLDPVGRIGSESGNHVGHRTSGEVLAELVPDDGRAGAQQGQGEGAGADPRLEDTLPGTEVRRDE